MCSEKYEYSPNQKQRRQGGFTGEEGTKMSKRLGIFTLNS
jgi:hypothetical protein